MMKDIFDIVHVRQGLLLSISTNAHEGNLPLAHRESVLLLTLDNVLVRDNLCSLGISG